MNSRFKLGVSIVSFALILSVMAFGVYAAVVGSYSIKNSIGYQSSPGVLAKFSGKITGASKDAGKFVAGISDIADIPLVGYDPVAGTGSMEENVGALYFVENVDGTAVYDITFVITVENIGTEVDGNKNFSLVVTLAETMINNTNNITYSVQYAADESGSRTNLPFNTETETNKTEATPEITFGNSLTIFITYSMATLTEVDAVVNDITITAK